TSKNTYALESNELSTTWQLDYVGEKVDSGNASEDFRRNYSKENAYIMFNVPIGTPKPTVGLLSVEHRLLHYFMTYMLVPRSGNHGLILDEDLEILWRMVNGQQINWVHMFVTHMRRIKPGNSKGLPYAILWTAIFKYVGIDLSQADKKRLGYNNCIDTHVLNHMKRNIQETRTRSPSTRRRSTTTRASSTTIRATIRPTIFERHHASNPSHGA
ncbi:hypothetical protein PIB30_099210, partial [Stylosanthes scabra]|nr:hypothetical protein [Stylosanthes scabra]